MKQLFYLCLCLSIAFVSCEKDETTPSADPLKLVDNSKIKNNKVKAVSYYSYKCTKTRVNTGNQTHGTICRPSQGSGCGGAHPCTAETPLSEVVDDLIQTHFSALEIQNWDDNEDIMNLEYINDHYDFHMEMYNLGLSFHPDSIIEINGW